MRYLVGRVVGVVTSHSAGLPFILKPRVRGSTVTWSKQKPSSPSSACYYDGIIIDGDAGTSTSGISSSTKSPAAIR